MKKEKLKTCQEICNRLRWDPQFDESDFDVLYEGRFEGTCQLSLPEFRYGEVPWHRVLAIKGPRGVVWDRAQRVDRICGSGDEPQFTLEKLEPKTEKKEEGLFSILSMNVLFDCYDDVDFRPKERWPHLLAFLEKEDTTLIALQEVTPSFFDLLKEKCWFKENYQCVDTEDGRRLTPFGPLLLSKKTIIGTHWPAVGRGNRALVATIQIDEIDVKVGVLHLTSDYKKKKAKHRRRELSALVESMGQGPALIMGDFNFAKEDEAEILSDQGFTDLWLKLRQEDHGFSYAPDQNALAHQSTITGRSSRLDRIYLRGDLLLAKDISLKGQEPIEGSIPPLFLSDHFALHCSLKPSSEERVEIQLEIDDPIESKSVHQTALCLIPPRHIWPAIEILRHSFDRQYVRWPPHINLLYGFVPEEDFHKAVQLLTTKMSKVEPFIIELEHFNRFDHRSSSTIWLEPVTEPLGALETLQKKLEECFPQCNEQSTRSEEGFTPHLSVGQVEKGAQFHQNFTKLSFEVRELALISRRQDEAFARRAIVPLGKSKFLPERANRLEVTDTMVNHCRRASLGECVVTGSTLLDCWLSESDIDFVVLGPSNMGVQEFSLRLQESISSKISHVADAKAPLLTFAYQGFEIEIAYVRCLQTLAPRPLTTFKLDELQKFDDEGNLAITGYLNTLSLITGLDIQEIRLFQDTLYLLRKWAHNRLIDDGALGFLPGYCWALLTRWALESSKAKSLQELVKGLFMKLHHWDWSRPIGLTKEAKSYTLRSRDRMALVTSMKPIKNSARNVIESTFIELRREFQRAHEICKRGDLDELLGQRNLEKEHLDIIKICFASSAAEGLKACLGWWRKSALSLLLSLEQEGECQALCFGFEEMTEKGKTITVHVREKGSKALAPIISKFVEQFNEWAEKPQSATISFMELSKEQKVP